MILSGSCETEIIEGREGNVSDLVGMCFSQSLLSEGVSFASGVASVTRRGNDIISGVDEGVEDGAGGDEPRSADASARWTQTFLNLSRFDDFGIRVFVSVRIAQAIHFLAGGWQFVFVKILSLFWPRFVLSRGSFRVTFVFAITPSQCL